MKNKKTLALALALILALVACSDDTIKTQTPTDTSQPEVTDKPTDDIKSPENTTEDGQTGDTSVTKEAGILSVIDAYDVEIRYEKRPRRHDKFYTIVYDETLGNEIHFDNQVVEAGLEDDNKVKILIKGYGQNNIISFGGGLKELDLDGYYKLHFKNYKQARLDLDLYGAIDGEVSVENTHLDLDLEGAVNLKLMGSSPHLEVDIEGAGKLDAQDLEANYAKVDIDGAGKAVVNVIDQLDAKVEGVGVIEYVSEPRTLNKQIEGIGSIKKK